jgi:hypothetical protein
MQLSNIIDPQLMSKILKFIFVLGAALYFIYTFIMFRQIAIMKKTLITKFSSNISFLGLLNLFLAGGLFFAFLFFL